MFDWIYEIYALISGAISLLYDIIAWTIAGLYAVTLFIISIFSMMGAVINLINGFIVSMFSANPYASIVMGLMMSYILIIFSMRIWNIVSGISLWGFNLPKI